MEFKMKGSSFYGKNCMCNADSKGSPMKKRKSGDKPDVEKQDKKILKESNKRLIADRKKEFKSGDITRKEFKGAKKEIKAYTDVDAAKDHFNEPGFRTVKEEKKQERIYNRISKIEDKAEKANRKGKDKKAQRKLDKISKLEDRATEGTKLGQAHRRKLEPNKAKKS